MALRVATTGVYKVSTKALSEAEKMQRVPGIIFADGAVGRRARIAGTGIDVFEVMKEYLASGKDRESLEEAFHWLSREQLDAALAYYSAFPEEIDERLRVEASLTPEVIRARHPWPASYRREGTR